MRYRFFEFENFKGIRKTRLELGEDSAARVFTLVGLNESGKTTVLEAIDRFQATDENEVSPKQLSGWAPADSHLLIPIAEKSNFNGEITIRCGVTLDDDDVEAARLHLKKESGYRLKELNRQIEIIDIYEFADSRFVKRRSNWTGLTGLGRTKAGKMDRPIQHASPADSTWQVLARFLRSRFPIIWFFPNFLFDFPERVYLEEHEGESEANRFYRLLFQDILDSLERDLSIETHVVARARSSKAADKRSLQAVLLDAGRHVTTTVVSSWNRIFADKPLGDKAVRIEIGEDPPTTDEQGDEHPGHVYIEFWLQDSDGMFAIRERSLGFRWFFVYLLMTTYRGARRSRANDLLFLFDEPASNLHSTAQAMLLDSLADLSKKAVIVYTTHSHHLIRPEWLGTTSVVANEGADPDAVSADYTARRTDIRVTPYHQFASQHPSQTHFFQPILDVLHHAPSRLELVPSAVMVEGVTDFYLLAYAQRVVLKVGAAARLNLMPGGGAGTLDDLIQLYIGWARPFVALLDSDAAGVRERNRYVTKFGRIVEPRLLDLATASGDQSVRGAESLLDEDERIAFQKILDPATSRYSKKVFALGVQEALVTGQAIPLSAATRQRLRMVLDALGSRLSEIS